MELRMMAEDLKRFKLAKTVFLNGNFFQKKKSLNFGDSSKIDNCSTKL
jgi:hypothetical protein